MLDRTPRVGFVWGRRISKIFACGLVVVSGLVVCCLATSSVRAQDGGDDAKDPAAAPADAPADGDRPAWIAKQLAALKSEIGSRRRVPLDELVKQDKDGDCFRALIALLTETEDEGLQVDLIRALGRDELTLAAKPVEEFLDADSEDVRGHAAVSLEYIGSAESVKPLLKQLKKEKVERVQNNLARAAGRCGRLDNAARTELLKQAEGGKSDIEGLGAIVGLAYFEGDAKAARGVEKLMKKVGPPTFGRRGDQGRGSVRRTLLVWTLVEIGDTKSADYIEDSILKQLRNNQSPFLEMVTNFYSAAVDACRGDKEAKGRVDAGLDFVLGNGGGDELNDDARKGRDQSTFKPKGE